MLDRQAGALSQGVELTPEVLRAGVDALTRHFPDQALRTGHLERVTASVVLAVAPLLLAHSSACEASEQNGQSDLALRQVRPR